MLLLALALSMFAVNVASADEVDTAVEAFSIAGSSVGLSMNEAEKVVVKTIVRCVGRTVNGKRFELDSCAREEVVKHLPVTAQPLVDCMLHGKALDTCGVEAMLDRLPAEARGITQCIAGGRPLTQCGTEEALSRLPEQTRWIGRCIEGGQSFQGCASEAAQQGIPPDAQAVASCLARRADFGRCLKQAPSGAAYHRVLEVIDKFKADNRTDLADASTASIRNIIQVADGIREDDWIKVSYYGGAEVYKVAAKIVLNAILTPVFQPLIGPIADAVIQHRVDLFARLVRGVKRADKEAVTEVAIEGYLIMQIEVACALPMPDDMRETLCGTVGKIIKGVATAGADIVDLAGRLIERPLAIPSTLWDETQSLRERVAGKSTDCDSPPVLYAQTYARCYHRGAILSMKDRLEQLTSSLNSMCREYYDGCYFSNRFDGLCNPQRDMFTRHAEQIANGLSSAAASYVRSFDGWLTHSIAHTKEGACQNGGNNQFVSKQIENFKAACAKSLKVQVPAKGNPLSDTCGGKSTLRDSAYWLACERALGASRPAETAAKACRITWSKYLRLGEMSLPINKIDAEREINQEVRMKAPRSRAALVVGPDRALEVTRPVNQAVRPHASPVDPTRTINRFSGAVRSAGNLPPARAASANN